MKICFKHEEIVKLVATRVTPTYLIICRKSNAFFLNKLLLLIIILQTKCIIEKPTAVIHKFFFRMKMRTNLVEVVKICASFKKLLLLKSNATFVAKMGN